MPEATAHDVPQLITERGRVEPVPRRVRAYLDGALVLDTVRARYVWEIAYYPQFYVPVEDVAPGVLVDEDHEQRLQFGTARTYALHVGDRRIPGAARVYGADARPGVAGTVRLEWEPLSWFEEDEPVIGHPRSPYTRVDALRSSRQVRVELDGVLLAESHAPVLLFETGLPTRYYLDRVDVRWENLVASDTSTVCPYKGVTSEYWSVRAGGELHEDLAWSYRYPFPSIVAVAGLVAFYNEKLDLTVDGIALERPASPFA